jgi:hypothetical protein
VLVLERNDNGLALVRSRRARPEWLGSIPLAILGTLPLLGPGEIGAGRVAMSLALGCAAALLIRSALPRREVSVLERSGTKVSIAGELHEPLAIVLGGVREDSQNSALSFQADLITPSTRVRLLDATDPGLVASQAEELARFMAVPLEPGWGLDPSALRARGDDRWRPEPATVRVVGLPDPSQRAAGFTALGSTLFILCFVTALLSGRWERGLPIATLSLVLPTLIVTFGFAVSAWLLGGRSELSLSSQGLDFVRVWPFRRQTLPLSELQGVFAVSPNGSTPTHVLSRVGGRWLAFPLAGEPAIRIAAGFRPISRQADRPAQRSEHTESNEFSGARTASG